MNASACWALTQPMGCRRLKHLFSEFILTTDRRDQRHPRHRASGSQSVRRARRTGGHRNRRHRAQAGGGRTRTIASGARKARASESDNHHGKADRFPGSRTESAHRRRRDQRQKLRSLACTRTSRFGRGVRGCDESRERRNAGVRNHQPDPRALQQRHSRPRVG